MSQYRHSLYVLFQNWKNILKLQICFILPVGSYVDTGVFLLYLLLLFTNVSF